MERNVCPQQNLASNPPRGLISAFSRVIKNELVLRMINILEDVRLLHQRCTVVVNLLICPAQLTSFGLPFAQRYFIRFKKNDLSRLQWSSKIGNPRSQLSEFCDVLPMT